jgi:haloalkane dehalogenase
VAVSVDFVRTADERFAELPGFPYEPRYAEWDGLRLARHETGEGPDVVLLHGEPTWGLLHRKVAPPIAAAGFRVVMPDLVGFGRSDKPTDVGWYSYDRHVEALTAALEAAGVRDACFVVHDWGGPIGMRVAAERPDLCSRLVVLDTGFFDGQQRMTDAWRAFRDFVERTEDLPIGFLVKGGTHRGLADNVVAAYEAPFPTPESKAGARAFPLMLPTSPDMPGAAASRAARDRLVAEPRPTLVLWADSDPIIPVAVGERMAELLGAAPVELVEGAGHFLQEDAGEAIGERIARWLRAG